MGGVAANNMLRAKVKQAAADNNFSVHIPSVELCGDNGAMIAAAGYHYLKNGKKSDMNLDVFSREKKLRS